MNSLGLFCAMLAPDRMAEYLCAGAGETHMGVAVPLNFQEFNTITALIFAQLHKAFPGIENIDTAGIAKGDGCCR